MAAEHDIDDKRCDLFMGHAKPEGVGSRTGAKYIHPKPSYLADVRQAIDDLFVDLQPLVMGRGLGGYGGVDQPNQDDPATLVVLDNCLASAVTGLRKFLNFGAGNETRTRDPDLGKTKSP